MSYMTDGNLDGNEPTASTEYCPMGVMNLNGTMLTQIEHNTKGELECDINPNYRRLFQYQPCPTDMLHYHQLMHNMKLTHDYCMVLYDRKTYFANRHSTHRKLQFNRLIPISTTWKYPPTLHDGFVDQHKDTIPNCKVFFLMILTPFASPPMDPGQPMHDANIHAAAPDLDKDGDEILLAQPVTDYQGSVVAEAFDIVKEEHKEMQVDEPVKGQAGPSRRKGKQRAPPIKQYEADPLYNFGPLDNVPEAVNNQRSLSLALFDTLKLNHTTARYEKQLRQEAEGVDLDLPPQPQHKPPKPSKELKIKMTESGWAVDQTIMIRPTIQFWYRNVKKPVFYKCCSMPYKKSYQRRMYRR